MINLFLFISKNSHILLVTLYSYLLNYIIHVSLGYIINKNEKNKFPLTFYDLTIISDHHT